MFDTRNVLARYYVLLILKPNLCADLNGQSAMGYCAGKPMEKSRVFRIVI